MAVYNGEKYLCEAIDSILNQTFKNFEFLIINDGSTDGTAEILQSYHDPRIKIINNEKNMGLAKSLNKGLKIAKGKYIARMDADDISLQERLEKQLAIIEKNKNVGMVASWIHIIDENNNYVRDWHADREDNSPEEIYYTLFFKNCIAHSSVLFNKELILKIGGYDESFKKSQDYELWIRLSKITKIIKIKDVLVIRKEHSVNISFDVKNQHKINEEYLFLRNINEISPNNKFNPNKLLSIKYNGKANSSNISNLLSILNRINKSIIDTAPPFLRKNNLKNWGNKKRNKILKNCVRFSFGVTRFQKTTILHIQNIFKISRLSFSSCLMYLLLLIRLTLLKVLKFYMRHLFILRYPLEYIDFFFFKQKCSHLKITKDSKNILCIIPYMVIGGAERVILNIAKGTDREKFNFHTVTTIPAENYWYNKYKSYFQNIVMPNKRLKKIYYKYFNHLIKKLNIDIVLISNSMIGYEYLPQLKSKFKHIKIIDLLHAEESFGASHKLEWVIPYFDKRICISHHLRDYMIKKYRRTRIREKYIKRLKVIHNGIDIKEYNSNPQMKGSFKSRFLIADDVKIISFIGRFSSEKNPLLYIDIAKKVITRLPNYKLKFVMSGDGPEFDNVRNTINRYGLEDYFILTRMIENIVELLADTYILLVVSKREGIPFVILEAMAMGVPVISTEVGAIYEVIKNNINGYLINTKNNVVDSFTCKIRDLLTEKTNYHILAKKTRETIISKFSLEIMGEKYQNVFNELISEGFD